MRPEDLPRHGVSWQVLPLSLPEVRTNETSPCVLATPPKSPECGGVFGDVAGVIGAPFGEPGKAGFNEGEAVEERAQIEDGTLTGRVPSVKTLSQEHGVPHLAAEKALAHLKQEGAVHSVIGKGTYVK